MSTESIIGILLSIPIGLISGLYSGFIVTRYARFSDLQNELLRIVRRIEFMGDVNSIMIRNDENVPDLVNVQSDLYFLGHKEAGDTVGRLLSEIIKTNRLARSGGITLDEYASHYSKWLKSGRTLEPSKRVVFSLWPKL